MNQAIQVLDGYTYIKLKKAIRVDVMAAGQILACYICGPDEESLTSLYKSKQFEIEELIEREFNQDKLNCDGEIWLTAKEVYAY
jgi:hypothetical protein